MTPLHKASYNGHTEIVELLLAAGASTDVVDIVSLLIFYCSATVIMYVCSLQRDQTPLHFAAENGHTKVVEQLLAFGASKDVIDKVSFIYLNT